MAVRSARRCSRRCSRASCRSGAGAAAAGSARAVVDRPLDLGLELDVAAQEVVVPLAERLGVAPLARLDPPRLGELVEPVDQLLGIAERLEQRARAVGLD